MSFGAIQPLKNGLRTSQPPATFSQPMAKYGLPLLVKWSSLHSLLAVATSMPRSCKYRSSAGGVQVLLPPTAENSARMVADEKKTMWDGCAVSAVRCVPTEQAHNRPDRVPLPVRGYCRLCPVRSQTIGSTQY